MSVLKLFWCGFVLTFLVIGLTWLIWPPILWSLLVVAPLFLLGVHDITQTRHTVIRNYPLVGHLRYLMEEIRPEIQQYFVESETSGQPFSRELRSVVYQRAKNTVDTRPFGTVGDVYEDGAEWIHHSLAPRDVLAAEPRIMIGEGRCEKPYSASMLNISAMSFGSLSRNAVLALNGGAKRGGFYHNTGEGGISPYHLSEGGDLVWQIGTGYFGCRTLDGAFDVEEFANKARGDTVKMIEIKLSQGAKPGHGGILPGSKVTPEIARIRGVPEGKDVISPPYHTTFSTPRGLLEFVNQLREASGKPVGFKLCVGNLSQFLAICKAMVEMGTVPDFITVDGSEGGTGAAPVEFSNAIGVPLTEGLLVVHNCLVGCGLRDQIKVIASGKIVTGFNMIQRIAIAADLCNAARPMMFALGCIQALKCNTNKCPVGVATQNPDLARGLVPQAKIPRVENFHRNTVHGALEILGAAGLTHPDQLRPEMIYRRVASATIKTYADIYTYYREGGLVSPEPDDPCGPYHQRFVRAWGKASPDRW
ncbi:MAG: FMN-binding glutamate synthase family protein [Planctomycetes bacterium]|nr:FMN-binding glutamate synthase family protein [Planctomycetota bacterium]